MRFVGALHSLVVRLLWEQNVGGSNPLAPTIPKRLQAENENSLAMADAIKPLVFGVFLVFCPPAFLPGKSFRSVFGLDSPSSRAGFSAPNKLSLLYARINFTQCLQGFGAILDL